MMDSNSKYLLSCDIGLNFKVKVEGLNGTYPKEFLASHLNDDYKNYPSVAERSSETGSDLYVTCQVYGEDGKALGLPVRTPYSQSRWGEKYLSLPIKYKDLPVTAQIGFTVWDILMPRKSVPIGGTTFKLFGQNRTLEKGKQKLKLWPNRVADGKNPSSTYGALEEDHEVDRLEKALTAFESGQYNRVGWLDQMASKQIERINKEHTESSENMFLYVEFPSFEHEVLFKEIECEMPMLSQTQSNRIVLVFDPELSRENPVEAKYHKLMRSLNREIVDRNLRPGVEERKHITKILAHPPNKPLTAEEKHTLWKFRFSLTKNKKALTKFLKCVDWGDIHEAKHACELLEEWAPPEIDDVLELLGPEFRNDAVRKYATDILDKADDYELSGYLLQLVQAFRYEKSDTTPFCSFLVQRSVANFELANYFFWYLNVERNSEKSYPAIFDRVYEKFAMELSVTRAGAEKMDVLVRQKEVIAQLVAASNKVKAHHKDSRPKKIDRLRTLLSPQGDLKQLNMEVQNLPMPHNPAITASGIAHEEATVFKSALQPLGIVFKTVERGNYMIIFKTGDDLRQDQLVIQLVDLMDRLLKKENLDLKVTPYKVLATSDRDGIVEVVKATNMAAVLAENKGDIHRFFRKHHFSENGPYGIDAEVLDTFIRSSAGYCVITYLLGIGDRHLDNLLLTHDGRMFHIDFGYILGRDPKPFPPPFKLCKEMVEGMGGANSKHYQTFKQHCCEAFNILRKHANLIINLFMLMADANIPDIADDPGRNILKVREKFRLDLSDEDADRYMHSLINESVSALFPQMVEAIHKWAQYWRA